MLSNEILITIINQSIHINTILWGGGGGVIVPMIDNEKITQVFIYIYDPSL